MRFLQITDEKGQVEGSARPISARCHHGRRDGALTPLRYSYSLTALMYTNIQHNSLVRTLKLHSVQMQNAETKIYVKAEFFFS